VDYVEDVIQTESNHPFLVIQSNAFSHGGDANDKRYEITVTKGRRRFWGTSHINVSTQSWQGRNRTDGSLRLAPLVDHQLNSPREEKGFLFLAHCVDDSHVGGERHHRIDSFVRSRVKELGM